MKIRNLIPMALTGILVSCSLIKDAATVTINTNLVSDIPVALSSTKSLGLSSQVTSYPFSASEDLNLTENNDVKDYLDKIKSIGINSLSLTVTGLLPEQVVETLTLSVAGVGVLFTQTNISAENNTFSPEVSPAVFDQVEAKLKAEKKITMTISGSANVDIISFINEMNYDVTIKANALN